jgi:hypothetical protein
VVFLRVENAQIATDLAGVVYVDLPTPKLHESAQRQLENWAKDLVPVYVKGLGFDLANHLRQRLKRGEPQPVGTILKEESPKLVSRNRSNQITAVCSDKGDYSEAYYKPQFEWVARKEQRQIKRIFVRSRDDDGYGFSSGETVGIVMHLDQALNGVKIRWICAESDWFKGPYPSSLGFAIFGKSWLVHWGLVSGIFHDSIRGTDYGVLELLKSRFNDLWIHAQDFDDNLKRKIWERWEVGS